MKLFFSAFLILSVSHAQDLLFTYKKRDMSVDIIEKYMKEHAPSMTYTFIQKDDPCEKVDYSKVLMHVCFINEQMKFNYLNTTDLPKKYAVLFQADLEELNNEYK